MYLYFSLLDKGRQILMKDNLIDEERAKQEEAAQESLEQKLERLGKFKSYQKLTERYPPKCKPIMIYLYRV